MFFKRLLQTERWRNPTTRLGKAFDGILKALTYIAGVILTTMMLSVSYEVIMRYLFNLPTKWVTDVVCLMGPFISLLPAGYILKERGHIGLDYFVEHLGAKGQAIMACIISIIGLLVSALICWESWLLLLEDYREGTNIYGSLIVPKYIIYVPAVIGLSFLGIQFMRQFFKAREVLRSLGKKCN